MKVRQVFILVLLTSLTIVAGAAGASPPLPTIIPPLHAGISLTNIPNAAFAEQTITGITTRVSIASEPIQGNNDAFNAAISSDGRYVAFDSEANNLVVDTNDAYDVFVYDREVGRATRVSVTSDGDEGNGDSDDPAISGDGRYVAFESEANNLIMGDINGVEDVFVHDQETGQTTRVSIASDGAEGNNISHAPAISNDGRYVAFYSLASNLVNGDANGHWDIFVHDRETGEATRVSVTSDGDEGNGGSYAPAISSDGRYVAFYSAASNLISDDTNEANDVFVYDRETGQTTRVSVASDGTEGNGSSSKPAISGDGRYVAFYSAASNLVNGDANGVWDTFIHDRQTGETTRVSVASDGSEGNGHSIGNTLSGDGRYVAFDSAASNLVNGDANGVWDTFIHDRQTGETTRVSVASNGVEGIDSSYKPAISGDGRYVAFESAASNLINNDTNDAWDIFVHDRQTGEMTRVSIPSDGAEGNGQSSTSDISGDGFYVAFSSDASNLVNNDANSTRDVFVHDRQTGETTRVSIASDGAEGNGSSDSPAVSGDGRYVAFSSYASNLVNGDDNYVEDIFVHDRQTGETTRVSIASNGDEGNSHSKRPAISNDGRYVAFYSYASNLVNGDTNNQRDVFVHDQETGITTRVSVTSGGTEGNGVSYYPDISGNGRYVAFYSGASNLVSGDDNGFADVFVHDRQTGQTIRVSVTSDGAEGNNGSYYPAISDDGRYVAFRSDASNLVNGDTNDEWDVFVHDQETGQTTRVSIASNGVEGNDYSTSPDISDDGRYVTFYSLASNLVNDDTNGRSDIFVHDWQTEKTTRVSVASDGVEGNGSSFRPAISGDGRYVIFDSSASNLVNDDTNSASDIFVHDRPNELFLPIIIRD